MKTVLITGANKGIGFETAKQLAAKNIKVFITGRNDNLLSASLVELQKINPSAEMILMDVSSDESVANAVEIFSQKNTKLDVLINNAGILDKRDSSIITDDITILDNTFNTNAYGVLRVVKNFLPIMNKPSRIINISSGGGSMSQPVGGWSPAYCISKSLLNAITRHLAFELVNKGISVNAVCPGWVRTDMGGEMASRTVDKGAETPVWLATDASQELTGKFFRDKKQIDW